MAKTPASFTTYLRHCVDASGLKQYEVAARCGFDKPNILSMILKGKTALPIERVEAFAEAVGLDPGHLLLLTLKAEKPALYALLLRHYGAGRRVLPAPPKEKPKNA